MGIRPEEIIETIGMVELSHFDIRTVTMGISLLDCRGKTVSEVAENVYKKIVLKANGLVAAAKEVEVKYGIPIINKRISVTPISIVAEGCKGDDYSPIAVAMDRAAKEVGVDFIGGFSALVHIGTGNGDQKLMDSIPVALSTTDRVYLINNLILSHYGLGYFLA